MKSWLIAALVLAALPASELAAADLTGTLQEVKRSGKIRLGFRESQPPISSRAKGGVAVGYAIGLCKEVVAEAKKALGADTGIEYVAVTAENRFEALAGGTVDLLCAATTRTIPAARSSISRCRRSWPVARS